MYAVVYKNRVIVGPMNWNRAIYESSLEKEGIVINLPRVAPEELPIIINDDAKIMEVEETRPEINPMVQYYYGPLWDVSGTKAIASYNVVDTPIEFAKGNFKEQAAIVRYQKEVSGAKINIQDIEVKVDTSREGRNVFIQKLSTMGDSDTANWKFPEGWLTLTKAEFASIIAAGFAHVQSAFDWEKNINDQIEASTTKEELLAIEILEPQQTNG